MIGRLFGKVLVAPIRIINVVVKTTKACLDASISEPVWFEQNALDDIADGIEKSIQKITGDK